MAKKTDTIDPITTPNNPGAKVSEPFDFELFFEKNKKLVVGIGTVITILIAGFFGAKYYFSGQNDEAQAKMFQAQFYFKADSLDLALNGRGKEMGFLRIKEEYPNTDAANMASFYAGVIYLKKGDFKNAVAHLQDFSSNDVLAQARAYSLTGDAYSEQGNYQEAKNYYSKAAEYKPNKEFSPDYLYKLATAAEKANDFKSAVDAYDKILKEYPNSDKAADAKKYKAHFEEKLAK